MKKSCMKKLVFVLLCVMFCISVSACSKPPSGSGISTKKQARTITYDKARGTAKLKNVTVHDEATGRNKTINGTVSVQNWSEKSIVFSYKSQVYIVSITTSKDQKYITLNYNKEKYKLIKKK